MEFKLTQLHAENFMKLPSGDYPLGGQVGFVSGRNFQGKSSLLQAIEYVMGAKVQAGLVEPINVNEDEARLVATFEGDGQRYDLVIEFTKKDEKQKTGKIYIITKDGAKITGKAKIREFLGNPPEIMDISEVAKNQETETGRLRNLKNLFQPLLNIDVEDMLSNRKAFLDGRRDIRKDIKNIEGMFATHGVSPEDVRGEIKTVDTNKLKNDLAKAEEVDRRYKAATEYLAGYEDKIGEAKKSLEEAEANVEAYAKEEYAKIDTQITLLKKQLADLKAKRKQKIEAPDSMMALIESRKSEVQKIEDVKERATLVVADGAPDVEGLREKLNEAAATNTRAELISGLKGHAEELIKLQKKDVDLTAKAKAITNHIENTIESAASDARIPERFKFEVDEDEGVRLMFTDPDTGATVPFSPNQVAQSQMILGSLALTMAAHVASGSRVRFITVRDASLLDKRSIKAAIGMAEQYGFAIFPEIVTEQDGVTIDLYESYEDAVRNRA